MASTVPADTKSAIVADWLTGTFSQNALTRKYRVGKATVNKYVAGLARPGAVAQGGTTAAVPDSLAGGSPLPDPVAQTYDPYPLNDPGRTLILSDIHIPYHDKRTIELAVAEARSAGVNKVLLNGDVLDCYALSSHYKEPDKGRFREEIDTGRAFLEYLRAQFPRARIVYKEGNHDERLRRYLAERAPALFDVDDFTLAKFLRLDALGVEWVGDKRIVQLGRLPVVHGHEFRGGGGVNPARWLFLRSVSTALCGHFHRTSEHHESSLDRRLHGVWSVGCACYLYPQYDPNNKWNHGYAIVDVSTNGHDFQVTNRRILRDGRVV